VSELNKQVALKFIEAMGANDPEAAATTLNPDAFGMAKGFSKFAGRRNADVIIQGIEGFKQMIPAGLQFTIGTVTAEGDRVVIEAEGNAVTVQGKPYCNQYCFVVTLKDGKVQRFNEYFCSILANDVLWPLAGAMGEDTSR
jgi:limonene-1,2-epoxide hydrolase